MSAPSRAGTAEISLFGAALDTGNLGVSALGCATVTALAERLHEPRITLFDNGRGARTAHVRTGDGEGHDTRIVTRGAWISRRLHRTESLWTMQAASRTAPSLNANVRTVARADAVLDISGGDSFTDLYGPRRFDLVTLPKRIALRQQRPLVLLPQTYGPFHDPAKRTRAAAIVASSSQAWARDADGYDQLRELLGDRFDPARHRQGVDVAFVLRPVAPGRKLGPLRAWLDLDPDVVGVNVSGLLGNDPTGARQRFGLAGDPGEAMERAVGRLLRETSHRILLVPHVVSGDPECDERACERLLERIGDPERVARVPSGLGAAETKHVIGRLAWFAGARMHATIAALSSGVPAAAVAYSAKFRGVFAGCGLPHGVLDARRLDTVDLSDALVESFTRRETDRRLLARTLPEVLDASAAQFDTITDAITSTRATRG